MIKNLYQKISELIRKLSFSSVITTDNLPSTSIVDHIIEIDRKTGGYLINLYAGDNANDTNQLAFLLRITAFDDESSIKYHDIGKSSFMYTNSYIRKVENAINSQSIDFGLYRHILQGLSATINNAAKMDYIDMPPRLDKFDSSNTLFIKNLGNDTYLYSIPKFANYEIKFTDANQQIKLLDFICKSKTFSSCFKLICLVNLFKFFRLKLAT